MIQWVRLHALNAVGLGSIPAQGTRSYIPYKDWRACVPQLRPRDPERSKIYFLKTDLINIYLQWDCYPACRGEENMILI